MLMGAIYLEFFSVLIAFRPALHRMWAVALIGMHLSIYFATTIMFSWQMLVVGLLLASSPFAPERTRPLTMLRALPVIGDLYAWWHLKSPRPRQRKESVPALDDADDIVIA
jgi:Ni/Fe-hydrogenase subunit HybB-like protein